MRWDVEEGATRQVLIVSTHSRGPKVKDRVAKWSPTWLVGLEAWHLHLTIFGDGLEVVGSSTCSCMLNPTFCDAGARSNSRRRDTDLSPFRMPWTRDKLLRTLSCILVIDAAIVQRLSLELVL